MYSSNKNTKTHKTGGQAECCTDLQCETGLRNKYFEGKRLTADSFRLEQKYAIERRRLLNRAIHGWGVVYGFGIAAHEPREEGCPEIPKGSLKINAGLALDQCGRELLEIGRGIKLSDVIVFDKEGKRVDPADADFSAECWELRVHYAEQDTGSIVIEDSCRCKYREWDHTCETVRYSIKPIDCDECCGRWDCELDCDCGSGRCCGGGGRDDNKPYYENRRREEGGREEGKRQPRGGCRCICDHLINLPLGSDCDHLCEIEEPCGNVRVDVLHGVPIACINIVNDADNCPILGDDMEVCGPRRLVKRNDLLFDLIRGCDLTRISDFGWKEWHREDQRIPFKDFSEAFGSTEIKPGQVVSEKFWVRFSRPVRANTLRADCFAMSVLSGEREGGWWTVNRVPIIAVDTRDFGPKEGDPPGHVYGARIVVSGKWLRDAVRGSHTIFANAKTRVEVEVRGDLIVDCNGQTVDANSFGLFRTQTGNDTAGGTFLSTFRLEPAPPEPDDEPDYDSDADKGVSS
ncbi:MAG TPA: hypothetical protein VK893_01660 [Pyrinomonadaceae bacterium]|nr:hypothetical protein [Pyrinomonadaceae bacterium]